MNAGKGAERSPVFAPMKEAASGPVVPRNTVTPSGPEVFAARSNAASIARIAAATAAAYLFWSVARPPPRACRAARTWRRPDRSRS